LPSQQDPKYPVYLYHKANIIDLKQDMDNFQQQFLTSDSYSHFLEENWLNFKAAVTKSIEQSIPQRQAISQRDLPWLTCQIRIKMRKRKKSFDKPKRLQTTEAWSDYSNLRNVINNEIKHRQESYQNNLFDGENAKKKFWKYIKTLRKDSTGIPPLRLKNQLITDAQEKADALNDQFYSVFTDEDLSEKIPESTDTEVSSHIPLISFSVTGIEHQLNLLNTHKSSGPDCIPAFVLHIVLLKLPQF